MSIVCPSCGGTKSKRAELCADCRRRGNKLAASVMTAVSTPAAPFVPRSPQQSKAYHGRLREIALLERPGLERGELWTAERKLKKWALKHAGRIAGHEVTSSTELGELDMERLLDWLGDVIDEMKRGRKRPR